MDVLCSDKTGTLTLNKLTISEPWALSADEKSASSKSTTASSNTGCTDVIQDLIMTGALAAKRSGDQKDAIDQEQLTSQIGAEIHLKVALWC